MREIAALVFPGFELLDLFGPLELFGMHPDVFRQTVVAEGPHPVASAQGPRVAVDAVLAERPSADLILVPGGPGTRQEVDNAPLLDWIRRAGRQAELVMSVCTGAALLARAGLLEGRRATTNKRAFGWVAAQAPAVHWQGSARWVEDGPVITASGVSAGMDMALAAIARLHGEPAAEEAALWAEYLRNGDADRDPFALG